MKVFETQRKIAASAQDIFRIFEDPQLLAKWWGPDGFTCTFQLFEFKPQGKWVFIMHGPDGTNYPNEMIFREILAPNKIVLRHTVEPYFTLTVSIEDGKDGAVLKWHQDFDSEEIAGNIAHIVKPANEQIMEKIRGLVAQVTPK